MKQGSLFDDLVPEREEWRLHWRGMPQFVQEDLAPFDSDVYAFPDGTLYVHWATADDRKAYRELIREAKLAGGIEQATPIESLGRPWLSRVIGQDLDAGKAHADRKRTQSVWWPEAEIGRFAGKAYVNRAALVPGDRVAPGPWDPAVPFEAATFLPAESPGTTVPRFPVYVISKGRWETRYTADALDEIGVPFRIVVEPQEADAYRAAVGADRVLVLPFSNLGLGSIPARNWVWEHSIAEGHPWHWIMDDNLQGFYRLHRNLKTPVADGTIFRAAEDFATRFENVAEFGLHYFMFASRKTALPPYYTNSRVYSCICLRNDLPHRWRGRYNEDTDLSIRIMKDGFATILFSTFLAFKTTTMTMKGGNTEALYAGAESTLTKWEAHAKGCATCRDERPWKCAEAREILEPDGRWRMALSLYEQHPERTVIARKWGRWQHHVDYSDFKQKLIPRAGLAIADGVDDYGMVLRVREPETRAPAPKAPKVSERKQKALDRLTKAPEFKNTPPGAPVEFVTRGPVGPLPTKQSTFEVGETRSAAVPAGWAPDPFPDLSRVSGPIGFDTETSGLRWWAGDRVCGTSIAWWEGSTLRSAYLPTRHAGGNHDPEAFLRWATSAEGLRGRQLVGLNVKFDAHSERESGLDLEPLGCRLSDIGHRQALIDDRTRAFKLQAIAEIHLGEGQGKVQGVDVSEGAHVHHAATVTPYARRDAELPLLILQRQLDRIEADKLERVVDLEDEVQWAVIEMERNGMLLDMERLLALQKQAKVAHEKELFRLAGVAGFACNPSSADDMERLFRQRGIEIKERTEKTGRISLAEGSLDGIEDEVVAIARRCNILAGVRSRYLDAYPRLVSPGGVMRYSLHQLRGDEGGTISGRFSCSQAISDRVGEAEGANLQQVITSEKLHDQGIEEYDVRRLYIAPRGRLVVAGDAKQIEYRVFAHFTDNPALIEAYRTDPNVDFHEWVGKDVRKLRPDFGRKRIKVTNFRVLFGGGVRSTCEALGVSEKEGRALLDAYDKAFPDTKRLLRLAQNLAENRRYVTTYLGRRTRFGPNDRYHKALNAVIQGTAADYNKVKLAALYKARRDFDLTLRLTVHDEFVGDVPDQDAADRLAVFLDRQEWADFRVPILWSVGTGASWGEAK